MRRSSRSGTRRSRRASSSSSGPSAPLMADAASVVRPRRWDGLDRAAPIWLLAAAALLLLIRLPLGWLAYMSVRAEHGVTLAHYARVFSDPPLQQPLWNKLVLGALPAAVPLATRLPRA